MRKIGCAFILSVSILTGCEEDRRPSGEELREGAGEAVRAPGDYVRTTIRAQHQAQTQSATQTVTQAVRMFQASEGRNPRDLNELVRENYLPRLPDLPQGVSFRYNPQTGEVGLDGY